MAYVVSLLFFDKDSLGIKKHVNINVIKTNKSTNISHKHLVGMIPWNPIALSISSYN